MISMISAGVDSCADGEAQSLWQQYQYQYQYQYGVNHRSMIRSDQFLISVPVQRAEPGMREYGSASVNHQGIIPREPYGVLSRMPPGRQPRSSTDRRLPCRSVAFPRKRFVHPFTSGLVRASARTAGGAPAGSL
jgi:hypothetical protein